MGMRLQSGVGMRLQWCGNETTNSMGMRLQVVWEQDYKWSGNELTDGNTNNEPC